MTTTATISPTQPSAQSIVRVRLHPEIPDAVLVPSRSRPGLEHLLEWDWRHFTWRCSCEAATFGHHCWHVAHVDAEVRKHAATYDDVSEWDFDFGRTYFLRQWVKHQPVAA